MGRKVSLPSGGYLVIEHTEAMVVIDVNSGRYAKSKDQELNSLKTDLEASREIARQLRLRDIGGIIVIDFIDLEDEKNRKKVYDELKKEFRKDRAKVSVLPMSDFGLIQITRQRIRQNIVQAIKEVCPECHGTGLSTKSSHLVYDLESWLKKFRRKSVRSII
jgi:ribonuclease G